MLVFALAMSAQRDYFSDYLQMNDYRKVGKNVFQKGEDELMLIGNSKGK